MTVRLNTVIHHVV